MSRWMEKHLGFRQCRRLLLSELWADQRYGVGDFEFLDQALQPSPAASKIGSCDHQTARRYGCVPISRKPAEQVVEPLHVHIQPAEKQPVAARRDALLGLFQQFRIGKVRKSKRWKSCEALHIVGLALVQTN